MRRCNIAACILLILSVFSFVLAAPVAVREVGKACADGVDVKVGLGKRADVQEKDRFKKWLDDLDQAQQEPSEEVPWSNPSQRQSSSLAPTYASGTHPNPPSSPGESKSPLLSTSGRAELSWNPEGETKLIQPGTSTEIQPASSSDPKSVSWAPSKKVQLPSGKTIMLPLQSEVIKLPTPPGREAYLAKMAAQQSPSPEIKHESLWSYFDPAPGREQMAAQQSPSRPSKGFFGDSTNLFKKLGKLKFLPRFQRISSTVSGTVDAAQRELQDTVDSGRRVRFFNPFSKSSIF
jgi:hypothetical protein